MLCRAQSESVKILAHVHGYPPVHGAGAEVMLHGWLRDLQRRGHDVQVLCTALNLSQTCTFDGIPVRTQQRGDVALWWQWADVVVTHLNNTIAATVHSRGFQKPLVHLVHNAAQLPAAHVDGGPLAVFNAQTVADQVTFDGPSVVLHPPLNPRSYRRFRKPGEHITLVNLNAEKGAELFWALVKQNPRRKFLAVKGAYGPQIIPDIVPPNCTVLPNLPEMRDRVWARTRVLLQPSKCETWGMCAGEAAAAGIPVIVTPTPGLKEHLGDAALYRPFGDVVRWQQALNTLDDPAAYRARSDAVFDRAAHIRTLTLSQLDQAEKALTHAVEAYVPEPVVLDLAQEQMLQTGIWVVDRKVLKLVPAEFYERRMRGRTGVFLYRPG